MVEIGFEGEKIKRKEEGERFVLCEWIELSQKLLKSNEKANLAQFYPISIDRAFQVYFRDFDFIFGLEWSRKSSSFLSFSPPFSHFTLTQFLNSSSISFFFDFFALIHMSSSPN